MSWSYVSSHWRLQRAHAAVLQLAQVQAQVVQLHDGGHNAIDAHGHGQGDDLEPQIVQVPAQAARQVWWEVTAPATLAELRPGEMLWEVEAQEAGDKPEAARDVLKVNQRIVAATPVSVQQATLVQLGDQPTTMGCICY